MINYHKIVGGPLRTNTYVVYDNEFGIIVDPGIHPDVITRVIKSLGIVKVGLVIATHGHFDHVFYANRVSRLYNSKLLIHELDFELLSSGRFLAEDLYSDVFELPELTEVISSETTLRFTKELEIRILHTPGHTRGSLCLVIGNLLITGDTLFKGTVGRTDLPGASPRDMRNSLIKLIKLPGDYLVLPGHGDLTTLEYERRSNPYLRKLLI
ncbi:MAG: MBL fold metallo-hydrolase [Desulfurococcaceae archaeon TW002]